MSIKIKNILSKLCEIVKFKWLIKGWHDFYRKDKNLWMKVMFSISFSLIIIGSVFASLIQTDFGKIKITTLRFPTENGQLVAADLYKPEAVSVQNKAPLIIVVPGFQRTKETQIGASLELARRGFVVICFDPYNQGDSTSTQSSQSATTEGYGLFSLIEYIYNTNVLNYIDKTKISATGHSAGGNAAIRAAAHFGRLAREEGTTSKLHSIYVSGYIETITDSVMRDAAGTNMAIGYALYDEGAFRAENANNGVNDENGYLDGDMRYASEALRFVNSVMTDPIEEVEIGKVYGHPEEKTLRMVFNEKTLHAFQPYDKSANAHIVEFFQIALDWDSELSTYDQTWIYKEFFSLLSLIGTFLILLPLAGLLLKIPFFAPVKKEIPEPVPSKTGIEKIVWWGTILLGITIAAATFIPFCNLSLTIFKDASNSNQTWFFPQRMNNAVMIWAFLNGLIGIALFLTHYFIMRKINKDKPSTFKSWGLDISIKNFIKTVLLGISVIGIVFLIVNIVYYFGHVDFRFMFFAIQPFQPLLLEVLLMYVPFFLVFYFSSSLRVNGSFRIKGVKTWKSLLVAGFANSGGLIVILLIQYISFATTGTIAFNKNADGVQLWLYVNMLFSMAPLMFILPYFNYYFFKLTGRTYLGPIVTCILFVMMSLSASVMYVPL